MYSSALMYSLRNVLDRRMTILAEIDWRRTRWTVSPQAKIKLEQKLGKARAKRVLKALLKRIDIRKCKGDFSQTRSILKSLGLSEKEATETIEDLSGYGGFCDCEVVFNVLLHSPSPMYKATCSICGKECFVPFNPDPNRPVYCRECWTMKKYCERAKEIELRRKFRERISMLEEERRRVRESVKKS